MKVREEGEKDGEKDGEEDEGVSQYTVHSTQYTAHSTQHTAHSIHKVESPFLLTYRKVKIHGLNLHLRTGDARYLSYTVKYMGCMWGVYGVSLGVYMGCH